jgi:hypothetical protein
MIYKCNVRYFDLNISKRLFLLPLEFFFVIYSFLLALSLVLGEFLEVDSEKPDLGNEWEGVRFSVLPR